MGLFLDVSVSALGEVQKVFAQLLLGFYASNLCKKGLGLMRFRVRVQGFRGLGLRAQGLFGNLTMTSLSEYHLLLGDPV